MKKILQIIVVASVMLSCGKPTGQLIGTGNKGRFIDANPYGMVFVKGGTFTMGINDEPKMGTINERPRKVTLNSFWMDDTEVTNDEYRQFVNWVKDSIALRKLVMAGRDEFRKPMKGDVDEASPTDALLNWKAKIPWNSKDEEVVDILGSLYLNDGSKKEIDPSKLNYVYTWYDYHQAALPANKFDVRTGTYPQGATVRVDSGYIDENGVVHNVTIVRPLRSKNDFISSKIINIYPDTAAWMSDFQYSTGNPKMRMYFSHGAFAQHPVVGVSWEQAQAFCNWRTKMYYGTTQTMGEEFRLPTEAEWEYAARGGKEMALYPWGGNYVKDSKGCLMANFKSSPAQYGSSTDAMTMKTGSFSPNNYGLYDMAGNVAEWTSTAYGGANNMVVSEMNPYYQYNAKNDDPQILKRKVVKGGSWKDVAYFLQCGVKIYQYQNESRPYIGFRCVKSYLGD